MTERMYWIGSTGPFYYDDAVRVDPDDPTSPFEHGVGPGNVTTLDTVEALRMIRMKADLTGYEQAPIIASAEQAEIAASKITNYNTQMNTINTLTIPNFSDIVIEIGTDQTSGYGTLMVCDLGAGGSGGSGCEALTARLQLLAEYLGDFRDSLLSALMSTTGTGDTPVLTNAMRDALVRHNLIKGSF